jgi:hypothetical protein
MSPSLAFPSRHPRRTPGARRYREAVRHLETLEPRTLMSATASLVQVNNNLAAYTAAYDANDQLWVVNTSGPEGFTVASLARVENGQVAESYDLPWVGFEGNVAPRNMVSDNNGHLYISDFNGAVDAFDIATHTFAQYTFDVAADYQFAPGYTGVYTQDGGFWFIGQGAFVPTSETTTAYLSSIVRFDTNTHAFSTTVINDFDASVGDSLAMFLTAKDNQSVYVGLQSVRGQAEDTTWVAGTNRLAAVSTDNSGGIATTAVYAIDSANPDVSHWGVLSGLAADTDGTVWVSIANSDDGAEAPFRAPAYPVDQLLNVHVNSDTGSLDTVARVYLSDSATPVFAGRLAMDGAGRLWFNEARGSEMGYFDTYTGEVTRIAYPEGVVGNGLSAWNMVANGAATELTMLTLDGDPSDGYPIIQVAIPPEAVTFSGTPFNQSGVENVAIDGILLATFTAPNGDYTATVTWGDGTSSILTAHSLGDNTFALVVTSKTFATQGTFAGGISVRDAANAEIGTLSFSTVISDTPLAITSISVTNPIGKFADLRLTFTDDPGGSASWFFASINWGDSSSSTGLVVKDASTPGQYIVIGNHKYKKKGTYSVVASITTSEANAAITSSTATVNVLI